MDVEFLDNVMGEEKGVGKVDAFTGNLWRRWKKVRDEGPRAQVGVNGVLHEVECAIINGARSLSNLDSFDQIT